MIVSMCFLTCFIYKLMTKISLQVLLYVWSSDLIFAWGINDNKSAGGLPGNGNTSLVFVFCGWPEKINIFLPVRCSESDKKSFYFTVMTPQTFVYFPAFGETLTENILLLSQHCTRFLWNYKENPNQFFFFSFYHFRGPKTWSSPNEWANC